MPVDDYTKQLEGIMKTKPLCPILTIGFAPPEEGKRDIRRCNKECALYDAEYDQCSIVAILENLKYISGQLDDNLSLLGGFVPFEDDETFDYDPNTIGTH